MKIAALALAALASMAEGKKTISGKQLQSRIRNGQFNKQTLMRNAKPYGDTKRKLEQQQDAAEEQWQINGLYSVQFSSCLSMTVQDEDMFGENYINLVQDGDLVAEKSYILFTACETESCYYQADDAKMTFITDIASFFQAFADFLPSQVESYCEGCNQNYDYCMGNLEAQQDDYVADDQAADDQAAEEHAGFEGSVGWLPEILTNQN